MIGSVFFPFKVQNPIAVGAVGGSGTRVIAQFLSEAGYYIGSDLNESNDNLWFTLLFKRRDVLIEPRHTFELMADIFFRRMQGAGGGRENRAAVEMVRALARNAWLEERARTFLNGTTGAERRHTHWAWKEPNTHVVIDKLLEWNRRLQYIHIVRNGLDMAYSANQNQLQLWGPVFLGHDVQITPRFSLAYWCTVHRRLRGIAERVPGRVMFLDFDGFCRDPRKGCHDVLAFCGRSVPDSLTESFASKVCIPASTGRFRAHNTADLDPVDVEYVASWDYPIA